MQHLVSEPSGGLRRRRFSPRREDKKLLMMTLIYKEGASCGCAPTTIEGVADSNVARRHDREELRRLSSTFYEATKNRGMDCEIWLNDVRDAIFRLSRRGEITTLPVTVRGTECYAIRCMRLPVCPKRGFPSNNRVPPTWVTREAVQYTSRRSITLRSLQYLARA